MMKMHNVDTMSLTMTFRRYNEKGEMDWNYIHKIEDKIAKKMVLYKTDKINRDREIRYNKLSISGRRWLSRLLPADAKRKILSVYRHGKYDGYIFTYNETWQSLTIMLTNSKVEEQSATDIKQSVIQAIMDYLELKPEELNEVVVNRIDVCCDFNYDDREEFVIIKNILDKAPNGVYTYRKHLLKDDKDGYILKYYSVRKNKEVVEPLTIEDGMITIPKRRVNIMKLSKEQVEMCNYMEVTQYNKTKEIEMKIAEGRAAETEREKFVNVFRTEVKIKNNKLNAYKNSGKIPDKLLGTYYNDNTTTELYSGIIQKLFGANDFFRIDIALDIIDKDDKTKNVTKDKLKKLIKKINRYGFTKAKKYWVNKYSEVTFRNHIKKIEELGINVLTFDTEIDRIKLETESMKNFTNLKNSVKNSCAGKSSCK